jgi:hypothetical protein
LSPKKEIKKINLRNCFLITVTMGIKREVEKERKHILIFNFRSFQAEFPYEIFC